MPESPTAESPMPCFDTPALQLAAIRARDPAADGAFVFSVATTGVYCRPSCAARPALTCNLGFHATPAAAERAGFRPCRRCRPELPPRTAREAALVADACRAIEAAETPPGLAVLAAAAACSPAHFHRMFRRVVGVTPHAYAVAQRQARMQAGLATGTGVTRAIYEAGYNSAGRFYAEADAALGMTAGRYRAGGPGEEIRYALAACSLGRVLVAVSGRGICAILLGEDDGPLLADLRARFPRAVLTAADAGFAGAVHQVVSHVERPGAALHLPLDIRGTAVQRRVWEALRGIPAGQTLSYTEVASRIEAPRAARAVAGACAANPLAVAVPCHRVVGTGGALAGYRWGLGRKRTLLDREARSTSLEPMDRSGGS